MATKESKRRAKALMQDVKDGNPQLLKELEKEGLSVWLEQYQRLYRDNGYMDKVLNGEY